MESLQQRYTDKLEQLRSELSAVTPRTTASTDANCDRSRSAGLEFLESDEWDDKLALCVLLLEATPKDLAEFAARQDGNEKLIEQLLRDANLIKQMLLADGAARGASKTNGKPGEGSAQYGPAMKIYTDILGISEHASKEEGGLLQRLALATALEHAVPIRQSNPLALSSDEAVDEFVDPVKRYLHYEAAYLDGELDPYFETLSVWELRFVIDGTEPDETLAWGRAMLRNFRPDHILTDNYAWRYVGIVRSDIRYGSQDVKYDVPTLQPCQNILMNGGVCGRRAFFGRFILRAFGVPTTARPSRGHGALCHWTPNGWVVNLGPGWGAGSTRTRYKKDVDFWATTKARRNDPARYWKVKLAQWIGDVRGERRVFGEHDDDAKGGSIGFWYDLSLHIQRDTVKDFEKTAASPTLDESHKPSIAEQLRSSPIAPENITCQDEIISIPAVCYDNPQQTKDVQVMRSFIGGMQIYLPSFTPQGLTILRGGTWKEGADGLGACASGARLLSGGYGKYENWGFRAAVSAPLECVNVMSTSEPPNPLLTLDLGGGVTMELVYIQPGTFIMGGESTKEGRFQCIEVPKHRVEVSKGFYLGKYPVTQAHFQASTGRNPSKSTKSPVCPVDNIGEDDALAFCRALSETTGEDVRLPTEAEWEYACRAGTDTKWFFGEDPSHLEEYAWCKSNSYAKSHPVGQKKPNPWGLYDIYGNVCERVADKYSKEYYSVSPSKDPTGPHQGSKAKFRYTFHVPRTGQYSLVAHVVTANANQHLNVSLTGFEDEKPSVLKMPFTIGHWQESESLLFQLKEGKVALHFWRDKPPQYGLAIKNFALKRIKK